MRPCAILFVALIGLACGGGQVEAPAVLTVATSIAPHAWLIERIGGKDVVVHTVLRPGESPTTHQPSDAQVSRVLAARVFFRCGVPFESGAWFRALEGQLDIVDLRQGVATRTMETHTHFGEAAETDARHPHEGVDPHIWLSPRRLMVQARLVATTLQQLDPNRAQEYAARLAVLIAELEDLDAWIADTLAPYRGRAFVVFHPSWGYFADDYGLRQVAIEIEGKDPSDIEVTDIQEATREHEISVIYVQPQIAGKSARAIAEVLGARLETLDPLAPDIVANLRHTAGLIADGFRD